MSDNYVPKFQHQDWVDNVDLVSAEDHDKGFNKRFRDVQHEFEEIARILKPLSIDANGNVGIGTLDPIYKLDVTDSVRVREGTSGMARIILGNTDTNKGSAGIIWMGPEGDNSYRLLLSTGRSSGVSGLTINKEDHVGIGTPTPEFALDVADRMRVRQGASDSAGIWFYQTTPKKDRAFVGMAGDTQVGLWGGTGANWGLVMDTTSGRVDINTTLQVKGDLLIPHCGECEAILSAQKYANESNFSPNNVKLNLDYTDISSVVQGGPTPTPNPKAYEFMIGYNYLPGGRFNMFKKLFSINQDGILYCSGSKTGFVADYFVNRVGDTLEQGDVVVISPQPVAYYSGSQNNIPILEVDLTEKAYDARVCGIVARFVTAQDLPHVEPELVKLPDGVTPEMPLAQAEQSTEPFPHPLQQFAATPQADASKVQDQQMGMMVTLGAFAHCKVDADIAPISVGDLLTTSPTKGHAQKVLEPEKAVGTIVGKALAPFEKGRGKIPVLVMLQ